MSKEKQHIMKMEHSKLLRLSSFIAHYILRGLRALRWVALAIVLFLGANVLYLMYPYRNVRPIDLDTCSSWSGHDSQFPKVVHRLWSGLYGPPGEEHLNNIRKCQQLNPTWEEKVWNETDVLNFLREHYPENLELYRSYPESIALKADFMRYHLMYHFGGMYMDMDMTCNANYHHILDHARGADVVLPQASPFGVSNNFFLAKTKHPFFRQMIDNLHVSRNERYFLPYFRVMLVTGTIFTNKNYVIYPCRDQISVLPENRHKWGWLQHKGEASWQKGDGHFLVGTERFIRRQLSHPIRLSLVTLLFLAAVCCLKLYAAWAGRQLHWAEGGIPRGIQEAREAFLNSMAHRLNAVCATAFGVQMSKVCHECLAVLQKCVERMRAAVESHNLARVYKSSKITPIKSGQVKRC